MSKTGNSRFRSTQPSSNFVVAFCFEGRLLRYATVDQKIATLRNSRSEDYYVTQQSIRRLLRYAAVDQKIATLRNSRSEDCYVTQQSIRRLLRYATVDQKIATLRSSRSEDCYVTQQSINKTIWNRKHSYLLKFCVNLSSALKH